MRAWDSWHPTDHLRESELGLTEEIHHSSLPRSAIGLETYYSLIGRRTGYSARMGDEGIFTLMCGPGWHRSRWQTGTEFESDYGMTSMDLFIRII